MHITMSQNATVAKNAQNVFHLFSFWINHHLHQAQVVPQTRNHLGSLEVPTENIIDVFNVKSITISHSNALNVRINNRIVLQL